MNTSLLINALITAAAVYIVLLKLDIRKCLAFEVPIDVTFTLLLMYAFLGTVSGMLIAVIAGFALSVALWLTKGVFGYKKWRGFIRGFDKQITRVW